MDYDAPIENIERDMLSREAIVKSVVKLLSREDKKESVAIGICGKWGVGKTTVIKFIKNESELQKKQIRFIEFRPWLYTNQKDLTRFFFSTVLSELSPHSKYREKVSNIAGSASNVLAITPLKEAQMLSWLLRRLSAALEDPSKSGDLFDLKCEISELLEKQEFKTVIVIDDLDRLEKNEIRQIMKLVRSIGDFNNVDYLLSYDEEIVANALGEEGVYDGRDYLQKIVQLPINLPEMDRDTLKKAIREKYEEIAHEKRTFDQNHERIVLESCVYPFVENIREINLLINRFEIKYDLIGSELCPIDLLALTLMELKNRSLYDWVSEHRYDLSKSWSYEDALKEINDFFKTWRPDQHVDHAKQIEEKYRFSHRLNEGTDSRAYLEALRTLFPYMDGVRAEEVARSERRVCIREECSHYFQLNIKFIPITRDEIDRLICISPYEEIESLLSEAHPEKLKDIAFRLVYELSKAPIERKEVFARLAYSNKIKLDWRWSHRDSYGDMIKIYLESTGESDMLEAFLEFAPNRSLRDVAVSMIAARRVFDPLWDKQRSVENSGQKKRLESELIGRAYGQIEGGGEFVTKWIVLYFAFFPERESGNLDIFRERVFDVAIKTEMDIVCLIQHILMGYSEDYPVEYMLSGSNDPFDLFCAESIGIDRLKGIRGLNERENGLRKAMIEQCQKTLDANSASINEEE
jgi:hypothetical protein